MTAANPTASQTVELLVPGISCGGCIAGIERRLGALRGVTAARVNLSTRRVRAEIEPELITADDVVAALSDAGYDARPFLPSMEAAAGADQTGRDLLLRLGVAGFAAMNVMLLSISVWSGAEDATRDLLHWISALIALPAIAYAGLPFFRSALKALSGRRMNMDVPISLAICLAVLNSLIQTAQGGQHAYFDAGIMLIFFLLIGRYLDHRTRAHARSAAAELTALTSRTAMRIASDGARQAVAVDALAPGMVVEIAAGERVPADGTILEGKSDLDRALITGESVPVPVAEGTVVHAGMLNLTGPIRMRVTSTGECTLLAEIARMVETAAHGRTRYDRLADRAARIYAPGVHLVALLAFAGWFWISRDWQIALEIATSVLIITCPCALALAVPTVHTVATGMLLRAGIFLKDGAELERLAEVDTVVFDKTGTLTDGAPRLVDAPSEDDPDWPVIAALAGASRHPFSQTLAAEAASRAIVPAAVTAIREHPGQGVQGVLDGRKLRLGRPQWIDPATDGQGVMLSLGAGETRRFAFADTLRPDAVQTCEALHTRGLDLALLSGDAEGPVSAAAERAGIETAHANLHPGDKVALLDRWREAGRRVLMVGDGLNDGPALAAAHASISPASAADVSKVAAGLVFTGASLGAVATAIRVAGAARRRALESFAIAAIYNALAIPLALSGAVTPLIAAVAMSGSSILVVLNALRLRRVQ